jgi:hypothetical protein
MVKMQVLCHVLMTWLEDEVELYPTSLNVDDFPCEWDWGMVMVCVEHLVALNLQERRLNYCLAELEKRVELEQIQMKIFQN